MYDEIYSLLEGKVTGKHAESARANLARIISRMPDWAQAPLTQSNLIYENRIASVINPTKGLYYAHEDVPIVMIPASGIENNLNINRFARTGTILHELGHVVDYLSGPERSKSAEVGVSACNSHYKELSDHFMWLHTSEAKTSREVKILEALLHPYYMEHAKSGMRAREFQARTAEVYFAAYDALDGDAEKINTHMTQKLPNLWPPFRDHLIEDYKANAKDKLPILNEHSVSSTPLPAISDWGVRESMRANIRNASQQR